MLVFKNKNKNIKISLSLNKELIENKLNFRKY